MGTYTTNYNLFMPTVGETGWGELVNENFTVIDTAMAEFDAVLSKMTWDGDNVTFPGSVTVNGIFSGVVDYIQINGYATTTQTNITYATCETQNVPLSESERSITINGYTFSKLPLKIIEGIYITSVVESGMMPTTRKLYVSFSASGNRIFFIKESTESSYTSYTIPMNGTTSIDVTIGKTYNYRVTNTGNMSASVAGSTFYLTTKTP